MDHDLTHAIEIGSDSDSLRGRGAGLGGPGTLNVGPGQKGARSMQGRG
jgi:hypothetical protein